MQFLVSEEPRIQWRMLCPRLGTREAAPAQNPTYPVFWARNAIYHSLGVLRIAPGDKVLVPSFHCAAAVAPIIQYGARVTFYKVKRDCSADLSDIEAKIDKRTRAILVIHYFGFPQAIRKFRELCGKYKLYLIEDCAHVLSGQVADGPLGSFGDVSVFSWRKFLPIYDGGYLVVNNPALRTAMPSAKPSLLFSIKVAKNALDGLIDESPLSFIAYLFRYPYWLGRRLLVRKGQPLNVLDINNRSSHFDISLVNLKMSSFSKYILQNIDLAAVVKKRRANYYFLLRELGALPGITATFGDLPEGLCPWVFPILVSRRTDFHLALRSKGIPAVTWGGVIHPQLALRDFPDADFLYQNLVLLPIHQDLGEVELRFMVEVLSEVLLGGNVPNVNRLAVGGTL
jgi:dTDP-4-amino-4,6-dideoxygalactose transaminase